MVIIIMINMT